MATLAGELGFAGGEVIEPGCGAGVFIGLAPEDARDGRRRAGRARPHDRRAAVPAREDRQPLVRRAGARPARGPASTLAIGNVPFGKVTLYDPEHNRSGHSIHNHFIVKSLALTQPGGLAVLLTSRYTLDAANPAARREMSQLADLLGAVRLPSGAHRRVAGTDAVTDLLVFRRRPAGSEPSDETWIRTQEVDVDGVGVRINSYLAEHPEQVLGALKLGRGLYDADELVVEQLADVPALAELISSWAAGSRQASRQPPCPHGPRVEPEPRAAGARGARGAVGRASVGAARRRLRRGPRRGAGADRAAARDRARSCGCCSRCATARRALLAAEAASVEDTPAIDQLRAQPARRLRAPMRRGTGRSTASASDGPAARSTDEETGEQREAMAPHHPPAIRMLARTDPFGPLVLSLEVFDEQTGPRGAGDAAARAGRRAPRAGARRRHAAGRARGLPGHARHASSSRRSPRCSARTEQDARAQLGELVYDDARRASCCPPPSTCPGTCARSSSRRAAAAVDRPALRSTSPRWSGCCPADLGADEVRAAARRRVDQREDHQRVPGGDPRRSDAVRVEHAGGDGVGGARQPHASLRPAASGAPAA